MERIIHTLQPGESIQISVYAHDKYSRHVISVESGQEYKVSYMKGRWIDLMIPATAAGYKNPLANLFGQRLKGVNCFCLCGAYNNSDAGTFAIGSEHTFTAQDSGSLSFFANDVPGYDWNNWGYIDIIIKRLK